MKILNKLKNICYNNLIKKYPRAIFRQNTSSVIMFLFLDSPTLTIQFTLFIPIVEYCFHYCLKNVTKDLKINGKYLNHYLHIESYAYDSSGVS